ncbi:MAG: hypothetical protein ACRYFS_17355 [Janthinobacterium lividum]
MTKTFDNLPPEPDNIPAALRSLPQWVVWKLETRPGQAKLTKVPYDARTGYKADSTDADTWSPLETALAAYAKARSGYSGIGFVFSRDDPYAGIDLDGCRDSETGEIEPWAQAVIDRMNSYAEISPSGTGIKIIVIAAHPGEGFKKDLKNGRAYEMYDAARYFTLTGNALPGSPISIAERNGEFNALHKEVFKKEILKAAGKASPRPAAGRKLSSGSSLADTDILAKARNAGNGVKFSALYDQGWEMAGYSDHSAADFALCGILAFWTAGDTQRMDALFRASALMRPKWDARHGTRTYGQITLDKIAAGVTDVYDPVRFAPSVQEIARRALTPKRETKPQERETRPQERETRPQEGSEPQEGADEYSNTAEDDEFDEDDKANQDDEEDYPDPSDYPDPKELIQDIQAAKDAATVKRRAISDVVRAYLTRDGQLHRDPDGGLWYFHHARHDLLPIPTGVLGGEEFASRIALRFGLNRTESAFSYAVADVVDAARALLTPSVLRRWSHYDITAERLYISDGNGYMYRLDGGSICRLFNGQDGVLFAAMQGMAALGNLEDLLTPTQAPEPGQGLMENILTVNFDDTPDISAAAQAALWYGFIYSLPFESILPTKPIPVFIGEKGSGKSVALKRLSRLLMGPDGNVSPLPPKVEDFDAALYNSRFLWLDNVDSYQPWLMDSLACAATGQAIVRRQYYTNMGQLRFTPHCFLGITTREPKFRRDDVADRTLLFTLSRIEDGERVAEHTLMHAIDERRDALFAEYLRDLNQIVGHLRKDKAALRVGMRLADWGEFFLRFMRSQGREEEGHAAMLALSQEQMSFSATGDPLFEMLSVWIPEDDTWTAEIDAATLCKQLTIQAEGEKREVHFKAHSVGNRLQNLADAINRSFEVKWRDGGQRKRFYRFRRRPEGDGIVVENW